MQKVVEVECGSHCHVSGSTFDQLNDLYKETPAVHEAYFYTDIFLKNLSQLLRRTCRVTEETMAIKMHWNFAAAVVLHIHPIHVKISKNAYVKLDHLILKHKNVLVAKSVFKK